MADSEHVAPVALETLVSYDAVVAWTRQLVSSTEAREAWKLDLPKTGFAVLGLALAAP